MKAIRKISAAAVAIGLSFSLTACDPPMPEDLKVALAEKTVICEDGAVELVAPEAIADLGLGWSDAVSLACENMHISLVDKLAKPEGLLITSEPTQAPKQNFLQLPFALDAAVIVVNIPDISEIYLSADTIAGIFEGKITSWNDPLITADNAGIEIPNLKIVLPKGATPANKAALSSWVETLTGSPLDLTKVTDSKKTDAELATPASAGELSIASYSAALFNGSTMAAILTEAGNIDSAIAPATETLYSASTQLVATVDENTISLKLDPKLKPQAPQGVNEAALPYQALFPVDLYFAGEESVLVRTAGRYLFRQESQGTITSGTLLPVPESVRILAVKIIEKGLPKAATPAGE